MCEVAASVELNRMDPSDVSEISQAMMMMPTAVVGGLHRNSSNHVGAGPGRIFPCSFCGREFRNAQALGGHMNVHRRDRAVANQLMQLRHQEQLMAEPERAKDEALVIRILHHQFHGDGDVGEPASTTPRLHKQRSGSTSVITQTSDIVHNCAPRSSSSSSSPPSQASVSLATSLGCSVSTALLRHGSVDLELRLGHTSDM